MPFTEIENVCEKQTWNGEKQGFSLEQIHEFGVREKVQHGLKHFRNSAHIVYKTMGLDEFTLGGESRK